MLESDDPQNTQRDPETGVILGAAARVHFVLGPGFLEAVYQAALAEELRRRSIPFEREVALPVVYDGTLLSDVFYRVDFVANDVLVELKAVRSLTGIEESQVLNYLQVRGGGKALLINFGAGRLEIKRYVA